MANLNIRKLILWFVKETKEIIAPKHYARALLFRSLLEAVENILIEQNNQVSRQRKYYVGKVIRELIKNDLIIVRGDKYLLSEKGEKELERYLDIEEVITVPKIWDGKFRVIIFDIPENKRAIRAAVREQLIVWGFIRLQNSVWVYPYECQKIISLLKTRFGVLRDVLYLQVDYLENDSWLKKEFNLSSP